MRLRISPLLIALPFILSITACSGSTEKLGGTDRKSELITEYVSLSPSTTELINAAGVPPQGLYGRTKSCNFPPGLQKVPIVVDGTTPNFERIALIKPQRIVVEKDLYPETTIQKLKDLGIDTLVLDLDTPESYDAAVIQIARDSGTETAASTYLDTVHRALSVFKGNLPPDTKVAVLIGDATTGYMALGQNTLLGGYVKEASGQLVGPESGKFEPVSIEQIISFAPDVIVTQKGQGTAMLKNPQLKPVHAVAKGLVLEVEPDILLRNGGRVDQLLEGLATGVGRVEIIKGN